jgi:hypothetical protein
MYRRQTILCLILALFSCKKITRNYNTFTIKKDTHRSTNSINYSNNTKFNWDIEFDSSAIYSTKDTNNQLDINKLIGWSDCGLDHLESSIRFGWRWINDTLEIHWFKHENGSFSFDKIAKIDICKPYNYRLKIHDWDYELQVDGVKVFVPRNCVRQRRRYQLYPYFGGDETAPHDITIKIKKNV